MFSESPYLLLRLYDEDTTCGTVSSVVAVLVDDKCYAIPESSRAVKGSVNSDGSATFAMYLDTTCTTLHPEASGTTSSDQINTYLGGVKLYTGGKSTTTTTTTTGASGASALLAPFFVQSAAVVAVMVAD